MDQLVEGSIAGNTEPRKKTGRLSLGLVAARLTERHFVDNIPQNKRRKCVACAQEQKNGYKADVLVPGAVHVGLHYVLLVASSDAPLLKFLKNIMITCIFII